jgi:F-box protein 9
MWDSLCRGRWRNMYLDRPHMRYDGIYVSRNTYIKVA